MKRITLYAVSILLVLTLAACSAAPAAISPAANTGQSAGQPASSTGSAQAAPAATAPASAAEALAANKDTHDEDSDYQYDPASAAAIQLNDDSISAQADGVSVDGSKATISAAGTYLLNGSLSDGQIIVNTTDKEVVRLVLNGVDITSSNSAPINIQAAGKVVILLAENTTNTLTDGSSYVFDSVEDEEPNAPLFSKADLSIGGSGSLNVNANFRDGINSKDGLVIAGGTITVNAVDDGVRGKDYLLVKGGQITVNAQGDGLKSDNEEDAERGYIDIEAGSLQVTAGGDAINAQTDVIISGGEFTLVSGGGSGSPASQDISAKAIKGAVSVAIEGGTFNIDAADDGIHSNDSITINGGTFDIASADDGMHADATLTINGGEITVTRSYEGIESAVITINDGRIDVTSSDDGINVAGGVDNSGMGGGPGRPPGGGGPGGFQGGQDNFTYTGSQYLRINGGNILVNAQGDGLDANGAIEMSGGIVIVNGPTAQMNAALDHSGFTITGGTVVAAGSSGMAQTAGQTSSQPSLLIFFTSTQPAGTLVHIQNSAGEDVLTFAPAKDYQSLAFSSGKLVNGETYTVYTGGSATGDQIAGWYSAGTYTPGSEYDSFTVGGMVTTLGTGGGRMHQRP